MYINSLNFHVFFSNGFRHFDPIDRSRRDPPGVSGALPAWIKTSDIALHIRAAQDAHRR